jgi:hypothetical protein
MLRAILATTSSSRLLGAVLYGLHGLAAPKSHHSDVQSLYSITANQAAIIALFGVMNRYVGNLPLMPGILPDYPASRRAR